MDNGHCKRGFFHYPGYLKINITDNGNCKKWPQKDSQNLSLWAQIRKALTLFPDSVTDQEGWWAGSCMLLLVLKS